MAARGTGAASPTREVAQPRRILLWIVSTANGILSTCRFRAAATLLASLADGDVGPGWRAKSFMQVSGVAERYDVIILRGAIAGRAVKYRRFPLKR